MTNLSHSMVGQSLATDTTRGPSQTIWGDFSDLFDPRNGFSFFDDFDSFSNVIAEASLSAVYHSGSGGSVWTSYEDTGCTPASQADERTGVVSLLTDTTDNDEISIQRGDATSVHAMISDTAGSQYRMAWEARVKISSITDSEVKWFAGMASEGAAAADFIGDAGALANMADVDYIGFFVAEADGDALTTAYNITGGTDTTVETYGTALVADTWYKLGMAFRPGGENGDKVITFYVDGKPTATTITDSTSTDPGFTSNFPDGEELSTIFALKNATTTAMALDVDWVCFAQSNDPA